MKKLTLLLPLLFLTSCTTSQLRTACLVSGGLDTVTTVVGINQGATEANPIAKPAPAIISVAGTAGVDFSSRKLLKAGHRTSANALYIGCIVVHAGAATWNATQLRRK